MAEFTVYLQPNKKANRVGMWLDKDTIKIEVVPQPVEGKANRALVELLSKNLGTAKSNIEIVRGATTKMKRIKISSLGLDEIKIKLRDANYTNK